MADSEVNSADEKVVIEQRLLKIDEVFIYRIPPMRTADGHRAEDWNLAKPLATCSLVAVRRDNDLCIDIMAERPKPNAPEGAMETYLFAQSSIAVDFSNPSHKIEHWVNPVVDSSRYFAVRIKDSKTGREAFIGVGFRERTDATNFRMSIEDYINSLKREQKAAELQKQFQESLSLESRSASGHDADTERLPFPKSSLSLKEGEKLHINIKTNRTGTSKSPKSKKNIIGLKGLKKPPPPPDVAPASDSSGDQESTAAKDGASDVDWGDFEG
mmetsp:Transcript_25741/g.54396  ORF Transcript_25741/g.54396 Transcript_25741/m.54396 type:complete len:271 (-) Transcript_25741:146-958(-)|eukprot:CAMPEP_0183730290 /NCGR_PEP_ID=MMETSP0737-20130205/32491_1 /TAXON_ID=385413 /ORGANISM="Thalassiosira miniscula, Strain CCMP1093" /LENGTH=270 /DNA_ID=CAMNT_0025962749 /DNA_START=50 /DNA_END=862 /DNA_ORIENTATION=+